MTATLSAVMAELRIQGALELMEGETLTFEFSETRPSGKGERQAQGFVIRYEGELLAYRNECPHWAVDLDLGGGDFFDPELQRVYCKNHGALFVLPSGECETGPCLGRALSRFELSIEGQEVLIQI